MQGPAQRPGRARTVRTGLPVLLVVILAAVGLAACGNSPTSTPTLAPSVPPTASQAPAASEPAATAASTPAPSSAPSAASSAPSPSGTAVGLDACALLTPAEVSTILGDSGVQAKPMPSGGWVAGQCAWNGKGSGFFLSVGTAASIAAFGDPAAADAEAKLAQFKSTGANAKDVPGIGDGAAVTATGLAATSGENYLELTNLGLTQEQLVSLAKLVVAGL